MANIVTIYSTPTCHFCHLAKEYFKANNVAFADHNVAADTKARVEMIEKSGQLGVPVIDINGEIIVGFDRPRIQHALGIK